MRGDFSITSKARSTKRTRIKKKLKWDERGALEGLPLYMIILVIITALSLIVIIAIIMPPPPPPPGHIGVEPTIITAGVSTTVTVRVNDTKGNPFNGATVTIEGCGVAEVGTTGSDGKVTLTVEPTLPPNTNFGSLTVTVKGGDPEVTKTTTITVKRSTT